MKNSSMNMIIEIPVFQLQIKQLSREPGQKETYWRLLRELESDETDNRIRKTEFYVKDVIHAS